MKMYMFLADGFETVEALGVVDILRRGGVSVCTVSINSDRKVTTKHEIEMFADTTFDEADFSEGDALFIPGGIPGVDNLEAHEGLKKLILKYNEENKYIFAICAGPRILGHLGILKGRRATCYPGYEEDLLGAEVTGSDVEISGKVVTGRGMGRTIEMGLAILEIFTDKANSDKIGKAIQFLK